MGAYKYIKETMQNEYKARDSVLRGKIVGWRKEGAFTRVDRPTNLARARELGYKAKPGIIIVRVKVRRGSSKREKPSRGRKPSKYGRFFDYRKSSQAVAEERAARHFTNCEVLNSYYVGDDGEYKFFEAILVDRGNPSIANDAYYSKVTSQRNRVYRGLTAAGRKHRGIIRKGFGTNNNRPSVREGQRDFLRV